MAGVHCRKVAAIRRLIYMRLMAKKFGTTQQWSFKEVAAIRGLTVYTIYYSEYYNNIITRKKLYFLPLYLSVYHSPVQ